MAEQEPVEYPIDGVIDLHYFNPHEVKSLIPEYIYTCLEKGIFIIRIIHGKGKGILRSRVHSILSRIEEVESFRLAGEDEGGWGATIVYLKKDRA